MRRILLSAAALTALTLTAPGVALASRHHHPHHHKRSPHHARVSFRHLGPATPGTMGPGVAPGTGSTPTPPGPTTPTTEENAGKVASYTGGVLTLTLSDGSTVSGKVTNNTRIECVSKTPTQPPAGGQDDEGAPGDDNGLGDDKNGGDRNQGGGWQDGQQPQAGDQPQSGGDENQGDGGPISTEPPCDSSALTEGTIVRAAELRIAPGGTEFECIELVR